MQSIIYFIYFIIYLQVCLVSNDQFHITTNHNLDHAGSTAATNISPTTTSYMYPSW